MKRTFQPKKRQEQKEHGFMKRMKGHILYDMALFVII